MKLGVVMESMDIGACYRLGETGSVIVKLLNRKDAQNVLREKHKLRSINSMMLTLIPTIKEKSSLIKAFVHPTGNFMAR